MAFNLSVLKLLKLQTGEKGAAVVAWQNFLKEVKIPVGASDGVFAAAAVAATQQFQTQNGLPPTGIVDLATYKKALPLGYLYYVPKFSPLLLLQYLNFGEAEIKDLQKVLNQVAKLSPALKVDGDFGAQSGRAVVEAFRQQGDRFDGMLGLNLSDATKAKLGNDFTPATQVLEQYALRQYRHMSGPHWVGQFLPSTTIDGLVSPFRQRVRAFEKALRAAGASINVSNTYRPPERAYLMHYATRIAMGDIAPEEVPPMPGVYVTWVHYNRAASVQAARQMRDAYDIAYPPALRSRHTEGLAIDWEITWKDTLKVRDANGTLVSIGAPRSSYDNADLWDVGGSYDVIKLEADEPHWSIDGY
jgi:peptidoglycan hydrolase-like protein with peptidoglycan-binding domain